MTDIALQTEHLCKRFGSQVAVDDLSLEVRAGEIFGFLGPNGAGKTTSILMMCGLLKPDSGRVLVEGLPIDTADSAARLRVGVCPQETILWDRLTCLEQLEFVGEMYGLRRRAARQRSAELLETLGLAERGRSLAGRLSGGMRRRLNLALALVHDPQIIVLDEPEAGLDPQSRVLVREYIRSLRSRKTVILTTHNMDEAERLADRVAIVDRGRLLKVDRPEALKRSVGEGEVVEIEVDRIEALTALRLLADLAPNASIVNHSIVVRGPEVAPLLPDLLQALRAGGAEIRDIHLRSRSLEDVFISLTGKRLRE
ncbi:MAG: ABC transporter ATP-binding protein [Anaerolineales bacterium]|nr:ABC transporter ATP-binding protein [Anaerolineales bacterium]